MMYTYTFTVGGWEKTGNQPFGDVFTEAKREAQRTNNFIMRAKKNNAGEVLRYDILCNGCFVRADLADPAQYDFRFNKKA